LLCTRAVACGASQCCSAATPAASLEVVLPTFLPLLLLFHRPR
jgi:hypothetical protein